MLNDVITVVFP